ncbi:hypothetical protein C6P46_005294 [Rhodotorula mucilaginosa]|uniref:Proteophosphoglycan ppg4 n=1 Tax=Rhodotorula mucilaginosa TaxID=5537 RepID=A0A9P6VZ49_RHOMI|nr:hypothetical protein C6P46_005294 [Rhodotorula mucilaginosa]
MPLITLPEAPPGIPPYEFYIRFIESIFYQTPARGFRARLIVLWVLGAYGVLASLAYFIVLVVEHRRRKKSIWLWKLVRRTNGRYLVGNFISCAVSIGYFASFYQVFIDGTHQHEAFYWRTLIWIVYVVHLWTTSSSNLQAGILSSQSAARKNILSPLFMNTLYLSVLLGMLFSCVALDIVCGWAWSQCWTATMRLLARLGTLALVRPDDTPEQALAIVDGLIHRVNSRLGLVITTLRVINALYAFAFTMVIVVNLGGLTLLFTLQRQIKFNMHRLADNHPPSAPVSRPTLPIPSSDDTTASSTDPVLCPFSASARVDEKGAGSSPAKQVVFVRSVEQRLEGPVTGPLDVAQPLPSKGMSVGELRHAAEDEAAASAAQRQQALQLLALKKVQWDVLVLLGAIVVIALFCSAIGLWLAISPTSVYARWATTEVAYFLVPWIHDGAVMGLVSFPPVPPGEDAYRTYLRSLDETFNPALNAGFVPRLAVLWALTGYGIVVSCVYMAVHVVDCHRRKKRVWLWKLVRRSKGSQHLLFAAMSLITCGLSIGLTLSFYQVFVERSNQRSAFFWRSIIWIPVGAHMWLSSYANLQASILATQEAAGRHLLSPLIANGLYLSGFAGFFLSVLIALSEQLKVAASALPNASVAEILAWTAPLRQHVNERYDVVMTVARVDGALYAFCSLLVICANLGGMALVLTLRRQIRFNLDRIPASDPTVVLPVLLEGETEQPEHPFGSALLVAEQAHVHGTGTTTPVLCSRVVEMRYEEADPEHVAPQPSVRRGASINHLKRIAAEGPHRQSAYRTQAKQVLALKKIELDFLAAVIALATACLAVGLWLLLSPRMIFGRLSMMELAYFFVIWMYLIGTDAALTFLLLNSVRVHLPHRGPPLRHRVQSARVETNRKPERSGDDILFSEVPLAEESAEEKKGGSPVLAHRATPATL